jgi:hypothetical protein
MGSEQKRAARRQQVSDYLDTWLPLTILGEQSERHSVGVWLEAARPVGETAAKDIVGDCPGYVRGSFKMLG